MLYTEMHLNDAFWSVCLLRIIMRKKRGSMSLLLLLLLLLASTSASDFSIAISASSTLRLEALVHMPMTFMNATCASVTHTV